jgi:hypothetical protein
VLGDSYQFETTETLPVGYALLFAATICVTTSATVSARALFPHRFTRSHLKLVASLV